MGGSPAVHKKQPVRWIVNGRPYELHVPPSKTLLEVLREDLGLVGTKHGCELGECGACTVLVDGQPVLSCLVLAADLETASITTVEGLGTPAHPHPLQQAFAELGAAQCGYCTPGMLLAAAALLSHNPQPDRRAIQEALAGNLCRCTGYLKIFEAVELAAARLSLASSRSTTPPMEAISPVCGRLPDLDGPAPTGATTPRAGREASHP